MNKGFLQVYTGNGKGKTTAAIGMAIRAMGAGFRVLFVQFVKGKEYSEIKELKKNKLITICQYGRRCFIKNKPKQQDIEIARKGLKKVERLIKSNKYKVVILDEATIATNFKLFDIKDLLKVINERPKDCEIIITGRYAPKELIDIADLVTEMKEIKHYYSKGIKARKGIEM